MEGMLDLDQKRTNSRHENNQDAAEIKNEGRMTTAVEERTAQLPSLTFLGAALGSMALSAGLMFTGKKHWANFVGQWAPAILIMGLYNKLVKFEDEMLARHDAP